MVSMIFHGHHHRGHMRQTHFREARDLEAPDVKRRRSCLRLHLATGRSENRQAYPSITCTLFNQMQVAAKTFSAGTTWNKACRNRPCFYLYQKSPRTGHGHDESRSCRAATSVVTARQKKHEAGTIHGFLCPLLSFGCNHCHIGSAT